MLEKLSDYIHVERGVIPRPICERLMTLVSAHQWQPNTWYDNTSGQTYSENTLEPDALFATAEMQDLLDPPIDRAATLYMQRYAYKDSLKTSKIISRFCAARFNRYGPGQVMRKHHDHIHSIFDGKEKGIPVLSFVGNLNEDYEGGELAFFEGEPKLALKTGDICIFPSCFLYPHQVLEVTRGQRVSFASWGW